MIGNRDNYKIYGNLDDEKTYITAIIDYISGMTDSFAIRSFQRLLTFLNIGRLLWQILRLILT